MERKRYQLLVLIATPKLADKAAVVFQKSALPIQFRLNAEGTASSEIMDTLGLGSIDKGLLISTVPQSFGQTMLGLLHSELRLDSVNSGIAFTVPLSAASQLVLRMMDQTAKQSENDQNDEGDMTMKTTHTLIVAIVNRGFSGDLMETARAAGAGGGTVIHSRSVVSEEVAGLLGTGVQEEKEIVLILAETKKKVDIMRSISEKWGALSEAAGVVVSLPIDSVMGI